MPLTPPCLSLDLEVGVRDQRIHRFAAVRGDGQGESVMYRGGDLAAALARLDEAAAGTQFLLGHNIIAFDLPHIAAAKPDLALLQMPVVDTLRLNPLAFPRNPYHRLVKHYQDGQLSHERVNDPLLDAGLTLRLFADQYAALCALRDTAPDLLAAWHWLTASADHPVGIDSVFWNCRQARCPSEAEGLAAIGRFLAGKACVTHARAVLAEARTHGWAMAYALAWLSVPGTNSVMPPWVCHAFPDAKVLVKRLRDLACDDPGCAWCREHQDARRELTRLFGFPAFRAEPAGEDGRPLQQAIVEAAMRGEHVLGILPTGTGKSLCYQIPALSRYDKTGVLTVVISPLVALMADQVAGLEARGITSCTAISGLLSMPERSAALDRVRMGDTAILLISPEQLRSRGVRNVLLQREIGAWVLDEAHCLSKWGHDFRPDYRYVSRVIKRSAGNGPVPPVLCLTATAKPDVIADIQAHFREKVGIELSVFNGGAARTNLDFLVMPTTPAEKSEHVHQLIEAELGNDVPGGAIVYCATRSHTEAMAAFLREKGLSAEHFHAGLSPEKKKAVQTGFISGEVRVIAATNAFGMGIDKPDVRLVVHADVPGSLENYMQEAGRAGRDRSPARCVLLYTPDDVERQFGMTARSRLTQPEIQAILKSIRRLDRRKRMGGEVVATSGEILLEEEDGTFRRDTHTDDTRVRTAISWLEESALLEREVNHTQVFPSSLRVSTIEEARERLAKRHMPDEYRCALLTIVDALIKADPDDGLSTDELMGASGLSPEKLRKALYDLESLGLASDDTAMTAYVHAGVDRSSQKRLEEASALEAALLEALREAAPDLAKGEATTLHQRLVAQRLKEDGHPSALPERVTQLMRGLAEDGRGEDSGLCSVRLRRIDAEAMQVTLQRDWSDIVRIAELRRTAAALLLQHLLSRLPAGARGVDLLAETTYGELMRVLNSDLMLRSATDHLHRLLDRALLWMHGQEVIRLNKGLAVFRPAMTIRLSQDRRNFAKADFQPLQLHYDEQVIQIHVMAEYVQRGLDVMADALRLAMDYFSLDRDAFIRRWLPDREKELQRQTTPESWRGIVESLGNPVQQRIVVDDREQTNVLVLAGPGSGKTRVLVHRIAYLIRAKRERSESIIALAYNRHAAVAIRRRLADLIGDDARGVTVLTCHALAMRLAGVSFQGRADKVDDAELRDAMLQAVALLRGDGLPPDEADAFRDRLLAGFRWILVDEYQDIGPEQYALIAALAGRTRPADDGKLSLFAVGDDDQNIYAFNGASVEFIRRFEADYAASPAYLTENYRSSAHIINAANLVIQRASNRMKANHPITVAGARAKDPAGGVWHGLDPVGHGRVQVLPAGRDTATQAMAVMAELERLAGLSTEWDWSRTAVIASQWKYLEPVRAFCEWRGLPVQVAYDERPPFWRLRETQALVDWVRRRERQLIDADALARWLAGQPVGPWWALLGEAIEAYRVETAKAEQACDTFLEWLAEWGREARRQQSGLLLLTAHRAKGLEFDHVAVLDGGWDTWRQGDDPDERRRLYYVAMTRAKQTLTLARSAAGHPILDALPPAPCLLRRQTAELPSPPPELTRRYQQLTPGDVDLSFAGRYEPTRAVPRAIAALSAGDPIQLVQNEDRWVLLDINGTCVCRLAKGFAQPEGMRYLSARIGAIITRTRADGDPGYDHQLKADRWEVVLPEFAWEPADTRATASATR